MNSARQLYREGALDDAAKALGADYAPLLAQFVARLADFGRDEAPSDDNRFPPWLAGLFLKREFRVLAGERCREYVADQLPDSAVPEGKDWFFELKNSHAVPGIPSLDNLSLHMADTCLTLQAGKPRVYNPLTGSLSKTALSILPDLVLLRDTSENVFVSCAPRPFASSTFECSYILPRKKLVLYLRGGNERGVYKLIRGDLARAASNYRGIAAHARQNLRSESITVADRPVNHLGHYLWNCLSAWQTLHQSGLAPEANHLVSWSTGDYFGNPFTLFPELRAGAGNTQRIKSLEDAVEHIHQFGAFWLPMYDRYIRHELAERVIGHCESVADQAFLDEARQLGSRGGPVILLTIRTGNRAWTSQQDGYRQLIAELVRIYPTAAFVLDGMNASHSDSSTHRFMDTNAELKVAEEIMAGLDTKTRILNTIGMPIAHSIVACKLIDAFVAPWGTAMTKYKWVCNKPGVAFGGQAEGPAEVGVRVFDRFRDDMVPAVDIPRENISDAGPGNLNEPLRRNFDMRWEVALQALVSLLGELGFDPDSA